MIRTILIATTLLAVAGAANAATIKVSVTGKTEATVRAEISKAVEAVCRDTPVAEYSACIRETYQDAMMQVARIKAVRTASLTF
ncbi:MAG: hypothetical protein ACXU82_03410 [Caulobacteraceae bacterium]